MTAMNKFSVKTVITDHLKTFYNYRVSLPPSNVNISNIIWPCLLIPVAISIAMIVLQGKISSSFVSIVTTTLSIFSAFLFNAIILVFEASRKEQARNDCDHQRILFFKQFTYNVSFAILISLTLLVILIIYSQLGEILYWPEIFSFISYYLLALFLSTMFMVLKRSQAFLNITMSP
ncbi:hypothetical protein [Dehalococcoides mccartyi]|jgi:hypothetical protein|uniref:hypothetical protein n=1 Tax=Dehalococcoides mccartyi TaxID=61435 RepID=UPI0012946F69|nr:hypothetical protein [Dehalococcoides mccartyi]